MKINVIGTSGSGKSTLSRRLAAQLNVPYIEMDSLYWLPDWQGRSDEAMNSLLVAALEKPGWVLDGNYNRTRDLKWRDVEVIVWVDYGFWRTLRQAVMRAARRAWKKEELWAGTGNRESFRRSFFSRESIIIWTLKTWRNNRRRYAADMANPRYQHLRFVRITGPQQADTFLASLTKQGTDHATH
ncbi:AAA family ATPase [Phytobacter sp. V91]|uniref:AAA family ATPase n=1 Tax=Phytobacter sp. V91 TaxID=3369425 RepID=UPI003F5F31FA